MSTLDTYDLLLFDGDCGICTRSAELAKKIARGGGYEVLPYQMVPEEDLKRFGVDYGKCSRRIYSITRNGRAWGGAFALNHFCWRHFPWTILPIVIYLLPPLLLAEIILYKIVARNRHTISRWFGLNACAIARH